MVWTSKTDTKNIIGPAGVRQILDALSGGGHQQRWVKTVCIGGINETNVQAVLKESASAAKPLDGVAVVSAIVSAPDPGAAARGLGTLIEELPLYKRETTRGPSPQVSSVRDVLERTSEVVRTVSERRPISHDMTNLVRPFVHIANPAAIFPASPLI